ncbi:MAG: hypothetical protein P4L79_07645 [Legionella sp.]|uniref:hypothetical protein n=1 Tax=Legionella sp. TaxID=459 RepID=UPI00284A8AFC|nr:hypothetical protein [Legionella sp.]
MLWTKFGEGQYNSVFRNEDHSLVLKIQKREGIADAPERSVRLWNEINPHLSPPAKITQTIHGPGWVCPYVHGREASDLEIMLGLLDIFKRTGRIVVDATSTKNFIVTDDGTLVCVDIAMAIQLEQREEAYLSNSKAKRVSNDSIMTWDDKYLAYGPFFSKHHEYAPKTINTIKALLFIRIYRPDIYDAGFLKEDPKLTKKLATAYDIHIRENKEVFGQQQRMPSSTRIAEALDILLNLRALTLENIKDSCINELHRYINSRGSLDVKQEFQSSRLTRLFRDPVLTVRKANDALRLINALKQTDSLKQLQMLLRVIPEEKILFSSHFSSGYKVSTSKCREIAAAAKEHYYCDLDEEAVASQSLK